jgi:hypothetical protein
VSKAAREVIADWLMVLGALVLFLSLFMTWSHQFSRELLTAYGSSPLLRDVPRDPTAWQVYSTADVILALVAAGIVAVAMLGGRVPRLIATAAAGVALAFVVHALSDPPTNHADVFDTAASVPRYLANAPGSSAGEIVAIVGLVIAIVGLGLSFSAD